VEHYFHIGILGKNTACRWMSFSTKRLGHPRALFLDFARSAPHKFRYCRYQDETDKAERQEQIQQCPAVIRPKQVDPGSQGNEPAGEDNDDIPFEDALELFARFSFKKPRRDLCVAARASRRAEMMAPGTDKLPEKNYRQATVGKKQEGQQRICVPDDCRAQEKQHCGRSVVQDYQPGWNDAIAFIGNVAIGAMFLSQKWFCHWL